MMESSRPNPDDLLAHIQNEEQRKTRGKLKIFLGYAAGVGKTYAMLEAAHQREAENVDVVVGYIETHGRVETEALLAGLEVVPCRRVDYRGIFLTEMDVAAILARRPQLVLVDELAHTNVPGSLHLKRYQDVQDILAAGINVYTTLNIQHLESLNDVVSQITGIKVQETIPDKVIDEASEIELVDLPPEELLNRLEEGKVYIPEQAARAIQKFFRQGNLTALRELSMRRAAERVDDQMLAYMQTRAIPGPWPAMEHLLVCISPNPLSEHLVRSARRLADELNADWAAVYVETPGHSNLNPAAYDRVTRMLQLAEELGARSCILPGQSIASTIIDYARQHNITKIIVGKPIRPRLVEALRGSVVDQLIRRSLQIDVFVISSESEPSSFVKAIDVRPHKPWSRYLWAMFIVAGAAALSSLFSKQISPTNLVMIYLLAVMITAAFLGRGPSIMASILSVLVFDFFFVPPSLTLAVSDTEYLLTFAGFLAVALLISTLTARVKEQAEAAVRREADTTALYGLSRDLAIADGLDDIIQAVLSNISQTFGRDVIILLPGEGADAQLKPYAMSPDFQLDEKETAVAVWVYQHGMQAGRGTETLPAAEARYIPLVTGHGIVGVMGVRPRDPQTKLAPEQRRLLEGFASQAALAIERARLADQARQAQLLQATEKLQTALLNSISHDLRTPLVSITGALSSLKASGPAIDEEIRDSLIDTASEEADRLNRLVGNLLNMTRLEAGVMRIVREPADVQDVIGSAVEQIKDRLGDRPVHIDVQPDIPLVPLDFVLIVHVLVNLIDNAIKYSPPKSPIEIYAQPDPTGIEISVCDHGIGIPAGDLERIFEKFYRVHQPENVTGTGLGLSISKGIVEAHGGRIWAENRQGGGALIKLILPVENRIDEMKEMHEQGAIS
jgi:two-component system, OmpR family, sensor histidine kinase KdpD